MRLVLGTAQFGGAYGITNSVGTPELCDVIEIVGAALDGDVEFFDTARAYGCSEQMLGKALGHYPGAEIKIVTKLSPMENCPVDSIKQTVVSNVIKSVADSTAALQRDFLDVVMLHRAEHLAAWNGAAWNTLRDLKLEKKIASLGVSVQSPLEALWALEFEDIEFIQLPYNLLDYRWEVVREKVIEARKKRSLHVHARSVFLQGLLTSTDIKLWERACCPQGALVFGWLRDKANQFTGGNVPELCLRFVSSRCWVDGVVVGVETKEQVSNNLGYLKEGGLSANALATLVNEKPWVPEETLNPAKWKQSNDD